MTNGATATVTQNAAQSEINTYLSGSTTSSYFVTSFNQYATFAMDYAVVAEGQAVSTSTLRHEIDRSGDAIKSITLRIHAPGLANVTDDDLIVPGHRQSTDEDTHSALAEHAAVRGNDADDKVTKTIQTSLVAADSNISVGSIHNLCARYCRYAPQMLLGECIFMVGNVHLDKVTGRHCLIHNELFTEDDKRMHECSNNGSQDQRSRWALAGPRTWYINLPFYFTVQASNAFPLLACQFNKIGLHVKWTDPLSASGNIIENHSANTAFFSSFQASTAVPAMADITTKALLAADKTSALSSSSGSALASTQFTYDVIVCYVYYGELQRSSSVAATFDVVCLQHQRQDSLMTWTSSSAATQHADLNFNFPVCALVVTAQSNIRKVAGQAGDFRGFSDEASCGLDAPEGVPDHLLKNMTIRFNNNDRQSNQEASFYTSLMPSFGAKCVPKDNHLYLYNFGLESPYDLIAGTANMSRLSTVQIIAHVADTAFSNIGINRGLDSVTLSADGVSVNVVHFSQGQASITYAS